MVDKLTTTSLARVAFSGVAVIVTHIIAVPFSVTDAVKELKMMQLNKREISCQRHM